MDENKIGETILGCALKVHRALGPGLLESTYEVCLAHEIERAGLHCERQPTLPLIYDGTVIGEAYRLDLLVAKRVVIEIKAVDTLAAIHRAQLLSYLKIGGFRLGYLLNFNVPLLKDGICRMINGSIQTACERRLEEGFTTEITKKDKATENAEMLRS